MNCTCDTIHTNAKTTASSRNDQTRMLTLRTAFTRELDKRFNAIVAAMVEAITVKDVLGINKKKDINALSVNAKISTPGYNAFDFPTNPQKVAAFMEWVKKMVNDNMLQVGNFEQVGTSINGAWTNTYIDRGYRRGVEMGRTQMLKAGFNIPTMTESGGLDAVMSMPMNLDRVGIAYTRTFGELKGITTAMEKQISQVLAEALANGDGAYLTARKMRAVVVGDGAGLGITDSLGRYIPAKRRARMLARTEIMRAHHQATIQEYENWATIGYEVEARWSTAGDTACKICEPYNGKVFSLAEIRGMIPVHPNCMCIALPQKKTAKTKKVTKKVTKKKRTPKPLKSIGNGDFRKVKKADLLDMYGLEDEYALAELEREVGGHISIKTLDPSKIVASEWNDMGVGKEKIKQMMGVDLTNAPPILVHQSDSGALQVLDGLHRTEVAKLQGRKIRAIVFDDEALELMGGKTDIWMDDFANWYADKYLTKKRTPVTPRNIPKPKDSIKVYGR